MNYAFSNSLPYGAPTTGPQVLRDDRSQLPRATTERGWLARICAGETPSANDGTSGPMSSQDRQLREPMHGQQVRAEVRAAGVRSGQYMRTLQEQERRETIPKEVAEPAPYNRFGTLAVIPEGPKVQQPM